MLQEVCNVDNLGFACRIFQYGLAICQHRSHHEIFCAGHGDCIEHNMRTLQPVCPRSDKTIFDNNMRTHCPQPLNVQVDWSRANRTTTRQRYVRFAEAGYQRPENENRCAHRLDELVGCTSVRNRTAIDFYVELFVKGYPDAHALQESDGRRDIFELGNIADRHRLRGQQSPGQNRQRCIFGARHIDRAAERGAALNE